MRPLDIIVPHYKEPFEVGKRFFDMLDLQRGIDFSDFHVLLVHDGTEAFPQTYFENRPYVVEQICIPHGGVSAARNTAIRQSKAEWITFSDFDDCFYSVLVLRNFLEAIRKRGNDFDVVAGSMVREIEFSDGSYYYQPIREDAMACMVGKLYRVEFLRKNDIFVDEDLAYNEDGLFNRTVAAYLDKNRFGGIQELTPVYIWIKRKDSVTNTPGKYWEMLTGGYWQNRKFFEICKKRGLKDYLNIVTAQIFIGAYYLHQYENAERMNGYKAMHEDFLAFYPPNRHILSEMEDEPFNAVRRQEKQNHELGEHVMKTDEFRLKEDRPGFWKWMDLLDEREKQK